MVIIDPYAYSFTIRLNEEIEGLPKEFFVKYSSNFDRNAGRVKPFLLRKGDIVTIGGTLNQYFRGKEQIENIFMKANYIYNRTLKNGLGLKIKKKEVFKGKLSGTATSDLKYIGMRKVNFVFSIKLDLEIEGIPNIFLVFTPHISYLFIKNGDKLLIEGTLFRGTMGKTDLYIMEMEAKHVYNITLKSGI